MSIAQILEEIFRSRAAFVSRNRFVLGVIMGLHISRLLRSGYDKICIDDLWGLREETLRAGGYLSQEDLSRVVYRCSQPHMIYAPWTSIVGRRGLIGRALGIYTDGGRAILGSMGFKVAVIRPIDMGVGRYIVETPDGKIVHVHIDREGIRDSKIPSKHVMAYEKLVEAFKIYGPFKIIDAINILSRDLGIDRTEARKLVNDLIGMGLLGISSGYIQPQSDQGE